MFVRYHRYQVSTNLQVNLRSGITIDVCMLSPLVPGEDQLIFKSKSTYLQESQWCLHHGYHHYQVSTNFHVNLCSGITIDVSPLPGEDQLIFKSKSTYRQESQWCLHHGYRHYQVSTNFHVNLVFNDAYKVHEHQLSNALLLMQESPWCPMQHQHHQLQVSYFNYLLVTMRNSLL